MTLHTRHLPGRQTDLPGVSDLLRYPGHLAVREQSSLFRRLLPGEPTPGGRWSFGRVGRFWRKLQFCNSLRRRHDLNSVGWSRRGLHAI